MATPHYDQKEYDVLDRLSQVIKDTKELKPKDKTPRDRNYAIVITELEKLWCIYNALICAGYEFPEE